MNLVSIIVPVYNVEKYLERCVESIRRQTYENLEIILVDDGSPDNCGVMCDMFKSQDKRIKVIHKKNEGLGLTRNAGFRSCTSYAAPSSGTLGPSMKGIIISEIVFYR